MRIEREAPAIRRFERARRRGPVPLATRGAEGPKRIALPEPHGAPRLWPHLVVADGLLVGETFRVLAPETIIGRGADADARPLDGQVSRCHARLVYDGDRLTVEDLGSSNGTLVGGVPVRAPRRLADGDVITLGADTKLRVAHAPILDQAVRSPRSLLAMDTADFLDGVRIGLVRARALQSAFTVALLRIDAPDGAPPSVDRVTDALRAAAPEAITAGCLVARSADDELVLVLRAAPRPATRAVDRLRLAMQETALTDGDCDARTLSAAVLPVSVGGVLTPETIFCALGDWGRHALAGASNRVVNLPALDENQLIRLSQPDGRSLATR